MTDKEAKAQYDGPTCPRLYLELGSEEMSFLIMFSHSSFSDTTPNLQGNRPSAHIIELVLTPHHCSPSGHSDQCSSLHKLEQVLIL